MNFYFIFMYADFDCKGLHDDAECNAFEPIGNDDDFHFCSNKQLSAIKTAFKNRFSAKSLQGESSYVLYMKK